MAGSNLIGRQIQGYTLMKKLGSGGYGTVYLGIKEEYGKQYQTAIKHISIPDGEGYESVLQDCGYDQDAAQKYFEKMVEEITSEINTLMELSKKDSRYIVAYYGHDIQKVWNPLHYEIFMQMEYLTPLNRVIRQNGMTVGEVIRLGLNMCDALTLCRNNGIMHRDIKEANIFVNESGNYKLGDFGVAKAAIETTQTGSIKGTASYMAPEIYLREPYDASVDLYSLGIVMYKLLNAQRLPFMPDAPAPFTADDKNTAETRRLRGEKPPLPVNARNRLGEIVVKACSAKNERYEKAEDFKADIQEVLQNLTDEEYEQTAAAPAAGLGEAVDSYEEDSLHTSTQTQGATMTMGVQDGTPLAMPPKEQNPYEKKPKKKKKKWVIAAVITIPIVAAAAAGYGYISEKTDPVNRFQAAVEENDYVKAAQVYQDELQYEDGNKLAAAEDFLMGQADDVEKKYIQKEMEYEDALARLQEMGKLGIAGEEELKDIIDRVNELRTSRASYESGVNNIENGDYRNAISDLRKVIQEDSDYQEAQTQLAAAIRGYKEQTMASLAQFEPDKQYEDAISLLKEGLQAVPEDADFLAKIADYETRIEEDILLEIDSIIREAKSAVSVSADYETAFAKLRDAAKQYPANEEIKEAASEIEEEYVGKELAEAEALAGEGKYEEAVALLNEALKLLQNNDSIKAQISEYEAKYPVLLQQMVYFTGEALENDGQEKDNMQKVQVNVIETDHRGMFDNTYKLEGQYTRITGVLYQPFDKRSDTYRRTLEIFGDGRLLYSESMMGGKEPIAFEVDLSGISDLEVRLVDQWGGLGSYHSGYAKLANVELHQ